jgi:hypothetical protein
MTSRESTTRRWPRVGVLLLVGAAALGAACADVSSSPESPASIEMADFPFPSVVVGDTLRDVNGVVARVRAIVRNSAGDTLPGTATRYLYADYNRDTALAVDSLTGLVVATKASTGDARIAARAGASLQVIKKLLVTVRPDTVSAGTVSAVLTTAFPDTGRAKATANTTEPLPVLVQNKQGTAPVGVNGWIVRFTLIRPANPSNDTTQAAWLVNDNGTASVIDTTDGSGNAGRKVRVRAAQFPTAGTDSVVVQATVTYKGKAVPGSGAVVSASVKRGGA